MIHPHAALALTLTVLSCSPDILDRAPAARVGKETVTRGFIRYAMKKLSAKDTDAARKEVLDGIIRNTLIAHKAREERIDASDDFRLSLRPAMEKARRDCICDLLAIDRDCDGRLMRILADRHRLAVPDIDWTKVFIEKGRPFIPFGGAIPKAPVAGADRSSSINREYASRVVISSDALRTDLASLLEGADDERFQLIRDGVNREGALHGLIVALHLDPLATELDPDRRALLAEVESRAEESLLTDAYRRAIGFESLSGGRVSAVTYPVTDEEARRFYLDNPRLFEEPRSVELSHILFRDFPTAEKTRAEIEKNPSLFCDRARALSIAPDATSCGRLGIVTRGPAPLPLQLEMGFTLTREGQLSVPFAVPGGVELLKLHRRVATVRPWDPVTKQMAIIKLQPFKREERLRRDLEEMKLRHGVRLFD